MKKIGITFLIILGIILVIYKLILSDYNPIFQNQEFLNLRKSLVDTDKPDLSPIVELYNKIHHQNDEKICPCEIVTRSADPFRHVISLKTKMYYWKVKKDVGHDKCLKLQLMHTDFGHGIIGVKSAARYHFKKSILDLTEKEKVTLLVMLENPALYNPERRKERVDKKVKSYQEILAQQNGR